MAKVSLRIYNREIENMIERGQLEEAIAHCRHILQTFPKYLETYRLIGKAYLEAKRYDEAVDIFQRVLMSVPDDFVSHVGMSIIADEQGKLDEAIWHMERAFEVQPSNAAIQGELQRLFGRRDGVQPPKIRLTRGALAHMYVQGELYLQAISEIQAVLGNDPKRVDMQVLLAKAYFRNNQKVEATDICNQLLKNLPYCLDANRIMVEVLRASTAGESTQVYRHRVNELDPYAVFVQDSIFHTDEVPDAAVSLERLDYVGQAVEMGAEWGTSLGIGLANGTVASESKAGPPDWLGAAPASTPPAPEQAPQNNEQIPDFMRQAGWRGLSVESKEEPVSEAEPEAVQADLPDWVKALAPSEEKESASEPNQSVAPASDIPDWLKSLEEQAPSAPVSAAPVAAPEPRNEPDWLSGLGSGQSGEEPASSEAIPDWLKNLDQEKPAPASSEPMNVQPPASPVESTPVAPPPSLGNLGASAQEQDDAMAWLESLAMKHGAKPEELVTDPKARTDIAPEWVDKAKQIGEQPVSAQQPSESVPTESVPAESALADETGMWLKNLEASEAEAPQPAEENLSDWRTSLAGEDHFAAEETPKEEQPIAGSESIPDWLSGLENAPAETPEAAHSEDIPEWLRESSKEPPEPTFDASQDFSFDSTSAANLPDWLAGLDKEEQPALTTPEEEVPKWVQEETKLPPEPTHPTDWHRIEIESAAQSFAPETESAVEASKPVIEPKPKAEKKAPGKIVRSKSAAGAKAGESSLAAAQAELGRGNIAASLEIYNRLIRKAKSLEEIIRDLRDALYRYPVEVPIWQALGDAYMRANRLQEALDAYTKAEELLR
jgi:tetratricopeptide (TPR) repeat protein